jgi:hypothetical protein
LNLIENTLYLLYDLNIRYRQWYNIRLNKGVASLPRFLPCQIFLLLWYMCTFRNVNERSMNVVVKHVIEMVDIQHFNNKIKHLCPIFNKSKVYFVSWRTLNCVTHTFSNRQTHVIQ